MIQKRSAPSSLLTAALILMAAASAQAQYRGSEPVAQRVKAGFESITAESCKTWLSKLASDEFEGRATGTAGYTRAAEYMAARFKEFGLLPKGDKDTWFQGVPFTGQRVAADKSSLEDIGGELRLTCGKQVTFRPASAVREGEVVFVDARGKEARLTDSKQVRGKVIIVRGLDNTNRRLYRQLSTRTVGMLRVVEQLSPSAWRATRSRRASRRVIGEITEKAARDLAATLGVANAFDRKLEDGEVVVAPAGEKKVRMTVELETRPQPVPNVVGFIEGSDPDLKHEVVIMGSHLDHLGKRGGRIYNGADDDGSGSTGLLAVARAFATNPVKPRRSLLFLAFCGEEIGLVGSRYYAENPIIPIKDSVCELQMDMIGRNEEHRGKGESPEDNLRTTHLVGSKRLSMDLHEVVIAANRHVNLTFEYDEESVYTRSDHYSFARKGIPIAFLFSGFHPDYHQATDTVDKINFEKLSNTAKLVYLTAFTVADRKQRLVMNKKK